METIYQLQFANISTIKLFTILLKMLNVTISGDSDFTKVFLSVQSPLILSRARLNRRKWGNFLLNRYILNIMELCFKNYVLYFNVVSGIVTYRFLIRFSSVVNVIRVFVCHNFKSRHRGFFWNFPNFCLQEII